MQTHCLCILHFFAVIAMAEHNIIINVSKILLQDDVVLRDFFISFSVKYFLINRIDIFLMHYEM